MRTMIRPSMGPSRIAAGITEGNWLHSVQHQLLDLVSCQIGICILHVQGRKAGQVR